jgi:nucleotide-binding universal stress UspA family protein
MSETASAPVPADSTTGRSVIVVGYSASAEGRAALQRSLSEATLRGSELVVVHTSPDPDAEIDELTNELQASGVPHEVKFAGDALDPADELLRAAEAADAEFIVIGLRRRSPVGKLLLGSNAQRVLLDAACPVLAVKAVPEA